MKINKKAFTLVEVIVATSILMVSVFGIYKLIGENAKLINNSDNFLQLNSFFPALEWCIDKLWVEWFTDKTVWKIYKFDFWSDFLWCTNNSSSWIILVDNIEYELFWEIISSGIDFIDFDLKISADGVWSQNRAYKLLK